MSADVSDASASRSSFSGRSAAHYDSSSERYARTKNAIRRLINIDGYELPYKQWRSVGSIRKNRRSVYGYQTLLSRAYDDGVHRRALSYR